MSVVNLLVVEVLNEFAQIFVINLKSIALLSELLQVKLLTPVLHEFWLEHLKIKEA